MPGTPRPTRPAGPLDCALPPSRPGARARRAGRSLTATLGSAASLAMLLACQAPPPPRAAPGPDHAPAEARIGNTEAPAANADPDKAAAEAAEAPEGERAPPETLEHLKNPALAARTAPDRYTVEFETTKGSLHLDVRRSWAPLAADRFYSLVRMGFFEDVAFFRVLDNFVAQTGLHGDPAVNAAWRSASIADDPITQSNLAGTVAFASSGPASRTTQFFINLGDNAGLDRLGFAPFGRVRELEVARTLYAKYGEGAPAGQGPVQARVQREGNAYLRAEFPDLDYVKSATIVEEVNAPLKPRPAPLPKAR